MLATTIVPPFPLSGRDLLDLGLTPGPAIGQILARLERAWIDSGFVLDRDELLALRN
jgi:poly(A) polymerase